MNDDLIPDVLLKAADVLTERGWYRGHYKDPFGCGVCLVGAISIAAGATADALGKGKAPEELHVALAALDGWLKPGMDIVDWNDEIAEDAGQVITALRECAASLKAGA